MRFGITAHLRKNITGLVEKLFRDIKVNLDRSHKIALYVQGKSYIDSFESFPKFTHPINKIHHIKRVRS